jgi:hypothetical protein
MYAMVGPGACLVPGPGGQFLCVFLVWQTTVAEELLLMCVPGGLA